MYSNAVEERIMYQITTWGDTFRHRSKQYFIFLAILKPTAHQQRREDKQMSLETKNINDSMTNKMLVNPSSTYEVAARPTVKNP